MDKTRYSLRVTIIYYKEEKKRKKIATIKIVAETLARGMFRLSEGEIYAVRRLKVALINMGIITCYKTIDSSQRRHRRINSRRARPSESLSRRSGYSISTSLHGTTVI